MRVLVAMSGGVDSSVAAAVLAEHGHEVVGATMKLWGGAGDSGCCSAGDVADARRVADQLDIDHHVFNFSDEFEEAVVAPYVEDHAAGRTPNPCADCNRHLKFAAFLERARRLGFDAVATGHHARVRRAASGAPQLARGLDRAKDQSYVLSMLDGAALEGVLLPVGEMTKAEVRAVAAARGLVTATKAESQEVCFVARPRPGAGRSSSRRDFLADRIPLHAGRVVDSSTGAVVGSVPAVELVTVGQRRGLGAPGPERRFALAVDIGRRTVLVGREADLLVTGTRLERRSWTSAPLEVGTPCEVQVSAHGLPRAAVVTETGVRYSSPQRLVAPGQLVACYVGDAVVGSGVAC